MTVKKIDQKRIAYQKTFNNPMGKEVLRDLSILCAPMKTSFSRDALEMAYREGRREVWLRIQTYLNLTEDDIFNLHQQAQEADYE